MTRLPGGRTDEASILIAASPEVIFEALTQANAVAKWLAPGGMTTSMTL